MAATFTESVNAYVDQAAALLGVEDDVRILVAEPYRQVTWKCALLDVPFDLGGIPGWVAATGRGVVAMTAATLSALGKSLAGQRIVIQGFGNVGRNVAQIAAEQGAKVVGVSDVSGGRAVAGGVDVTDLLAKEVDVGDFLTNAELLGLDCDVLIPAALENAIDASNVAGVRASLIVEAANHAISDESVARTLVPLNMAGVPTLRGHSAHLSSTGEVLKRKAPCRSSVYDVRHTIGVER